MSHRLCFCRSGISCEDFDGCIYENLLRSLLTLGKSCRVSLNRILVGEKKEDDRSRRSLGIFLGRFAKRARQVGRRSSQLAGQLARENNDVAILKIMAIDLML